MREEIVTAGQRLQQIRTRRGLSKAWLARQLGCPWQTIYDWEQGKRRIPADQIPKLARALQVSIRAFFFDEECRRV